VLYFALTGTPPFGEADPKVILARMLAGTFETSALPPEVAAWMKRAMNPAVEERFDDATEMQSEWREVVRLVLDRDDKDLPWWRRFFSAEPEQV
jgi:hypothetical protein